LHFHIQRRSTAILPSSHRKGKNGEGKGPQELTGEREERRFTYISIWRSFPSEVGKKEQT